MYLAGNTRINNVREVNLSQWQNRPSTVSKAQDETRIMTYNVQGGVGSSSIQYIAAFVGSEEVGILIINEMGFPSLRNGYGDYMNVMRELSGLDNDCSFPTYKTLFMNLGNSIHSIHDITNCDNRKLPGEGQPRYVGVSTVDIDGKKVNVLGTHLSTVTEVRTQQINTLAAYVEEIDGRILLAGDFNIKNEAELTPLYAVGLENSSSYMTYPASDPNRPLDRIMTSSGIEVIRTYVPDIQLSDHRPLVVDFKLK